MEQPLPQEATAVFRAPPDGFIAARDAAVAELRAAGRDEDAARVRALRKPTLAVWAMNQLADRAPGEIQALLEAGRELRAAQQAAASAGRGAERLREAAAARRAAAAALLRVASSALAETGRTATVPTAQTDAVAAALETASVDPEAGVHLATGTFTALPSTPPGFGDVFGLASIPGGATEDAPASTPKPDVAGLRRERARTAKAAAAHRAAADRLAEKLRDARDRVRELEADHAAAMERALASETDHTRAERALAAAERRA